MQKVNVTWKAFSSCISDINLLRVLFYRMKDIVFHLTSKWDIAISTHYWPQVETPKNSLELLHSIKLCICSVGLYSHLLKEEKQQYCKTLLSLSKQQCFRNSHSRAPRVRIASDIILKYENADVANPIHEKWKRMNHVKLGNCPFKLPHSISYYFWKWNRRRNPELKSE